MPTTLLPSPTVNHGTEEVGRLVRARLADMGRNQEWLGAEVAAVTGRPTAYRQTSVSQWLLGITDWTPAVLFAAERVLDLRPGDLSRHLGYLPLNAGPPPTSTEGSIAVDPKLRPWARRALAAAYREMVDAFAED